jgi:hypothetical protein
MLTCVTKIFTSLGIGSDDDSYHIWAIMKTHTNLSFFPVCVHWNAKILINQCSALEVNPTSFLLDDVSIEITFLRRCRQLKDMWR